MDEAASVRGVERFRDLREQRHRAARLERSVAPEHRPEVGAVDETHRLVQHSVGLSGAVDR
jgi:hypothetical protein